MEHMAEGMGLILIELCAYNRLKESDLADLTAYPEVGIMSCECLNVCGMCSMRPFAMVNGQRVFAETPEACTAKIKAKVIQELKQLSE
ncbi:uncharacterized protein YuzB (UPF0349 family) [Sporolactobacillus spathodeae]|uniref:Uncharacterized protein YuzB (UPF0349 family) n=2 Tax=Sporolactobacillus spathodeae TaxID=1465502 RepID=A0ABS2Q7P8_9BACL|nr:uncharacterized protein YuzB (UPF0349 family) [Sporolactobacillus spathodeae]